MSILFIIKCNGFSIFFHILGQVKYSHPQNVGKVINGWIGITAGVGWEKLIGRDNYSVHQDKLKTDLNGLQSQMKFIVQWVKTYFARNLLQYVSFYEEEESNRNKFF